MSFPTVTFILDKNQFATVKDSGVENLDTLRDMFDPALVAPSVGVHQDSSIDPDTQRLFTFIGICPISRTVEHKDGFHVFLEAFAHDINDEDFKYLQSVMEKRQIQIPAKRIGDPGCKRHPEVCGQVAEHQNPNSLVCQLPNQHTCDHNWKTTNE